MASEIKVDTIVNAGGDNDTGIDLGTNDQILLKVANATKLTMNATGQTTIVGEGGSTTTNLQQGLAKGFICVDVSAGAAFSSDDSFNIGSVTDNGTGNFGLAFTNNMATVRYNSPGGCYTATGHTVGVTAEATTGTQMRPSDNGGSGADVDSYMAFIGTMA